MDIVEISIHPNLFTGSGRGLAGVCFFSSLNKRLVVKLELVRVRSFVLKV